LKQFVVQAAWVSALGWLAFQAQGIDYGAIAIDVFVFDIIQQSAASANEHQKTPAGMVIFFVNL
jgi:hypothetical protein